MGEPTTLREYDQVHCLRNSMGQICVIFVVGRMADSEIYWNVDRKWDKNTLASTRYPAADGWYHIKVAVQGKQITVKTQDKAICDLIDGRAAKCFGLKLNGDVIEQFYTPDAVSGGGTFASWYDVTAYENSMLSCTKSGNETTLRTGRVLDDCQIYDVSALSGMVGEKTTVRVGDRIHALKDLDGNICVIFVVTRFKDYPTYYNLQRQWDATNKTTLRTPDAEGYYVFDMAYQGKQVQVKTKSKAIANKIDEQAAKCVALSVSGGIVYDAIHPSNTVAYKGGATSSYTYVTKAGAGWFTTSKYEKNVLTKTYSETMAANCKVYNVSDNVQEHLGEATKIQVGDYVHCLKNGSGQVALVYVMSRPEDLGVYYNLDRKWDDNTQATTRTPDADGNYVFTMAHEGEQVTVKTSSLQVANAIDSQVAKVLGIAFDEAGMAVKAIHAKSTKLCGGGIGVSYATVTQLEGNQMTTVKNGAQTVVTLSDAPNVFNVSGDVENNPGERTTLRVGDMVHCLKSSDGKHHYIYVLSRVAVAEQVAHSCQHVTQNVTWYAYNGKGSFSESGHYVLTKDITQADTVTVPANTEITLCLNGHTVSTDVRMFKVYGTLHICDHADSEGNYQGKLTSSYSNTLDADGNVATKAYGAIAYLYNTSASSQLNIYGGILEHTGSVYSGGLVYIANSTENESYTAIMRLYDGVLTGGNSTSMGGAVLVSNRGGFAMYGGTITGCQSSSGAVALYNSLAQFLMEGGTITGNTASGNGAGIHVENGAVKLTGGSVTGNTCQGSGGGVNVQKGSFVMEGGSLDGNTAAKEGGNLRVSPYSQVTLSGDAQLKNGTAHFGSEITCFGVLTMQDQAQISPKDPSLTSVNLYTNYEDTSLQPAFRMEGGSIAGTIRYGGLKGNMEMYLLGGNVGKINYQAYEGNSLFVGGAVQVQQIHLFAGKLLQVDAKGLEDTARIGISMEDLDDPFIAVTDPKDQTCFLPMDSNYKVQAAENKLYLVSAIAPHVHCLCNGASPNGHSCGDITWKPWDKTDSLPTTGNYYLTDHVTLSAMVELKGKADLKLCLNGFTVTGPGGKRVFLLRDADLSITDCKTTGCITNAVTDSLNGGLIYQYNGSSCNNYNNSVNLYGGTLTVTGTAKAGGILYLGNNSSKPYYATFNMYGGTITGGSVTGNGGNIIISNNCVMNLYGGSITGGNAGGDGDNINLSNGSLQLLGGSVTGGADEDVYAKSVVTVGGNVQVDKLFFHAANLLAVSTELPLTGTAKLYVDMANTGVLAKNLTDSALLTYMESYNTSRQLQYHENRLELVAKP